MSERAGGVIARDGAPRRFFAILLPLALAAALLALYTAAAASFEWFVDPRRYGIGEDGTQWVSRLADREGQFFLWQLSLVAPAALLLALALAPVHGGRWIGRLADRLLRLPAPVLLGAIFAVSALLLGALSWASLGGALITDDENAYLFQARILASGSLTAPSPPMREFFDNIFLVNNGRMYCHYPFGHPAILVPALLAGVPHLTPVLLGALTVVLTFSIGRELYDARIGLAAAALLLVSPQFLLTCATLLSQPTSLFFTALAIYGLARALGAGSLAWAAAGGLAWGIAFQVRFGTIGLVTLPFLAVFLRRTIAGRPRLWKPAAFALAACALMAALTLATNWAVNGSAFRTNYHALWENDPSGETSPVGFGTYPWGIEHTPLKGAWNTALNLLKLDFWFLGGPLSLLPIVLFLLLRPSNTWDRVWLATLPLPFVAYFFYFWAGVSDTGPVHFFELLLPLALLGARSIRALRERAGALAPGASRFVLNAALSAIVLGLATFTPAQVLTLRTLARRALEPYETLRSNGVHHAIVFMDEYVRTPAASWLLGRLNNTPDLSDDLVTVKDLKGKNWEFLKSYPDRTPMRLRYGLDGKPRLEYLIPPKPVESPAETVETRGEP